MQGCTRSDSSSLARPVSGSRTLHNTFWNPNYPATEFPVAVEDNGDPNSEHGSMALWNHMVAIWKDSKKTAFRQQCLQIMDDFSRMQNAGTGPDNLSIVGVPRPNSSILNVLSSLQGIAALRQ